MEVVLLERVAKLGNMGEVVSVKPGFARNFLFPQKKALRASKENLAVFEAQRAQLEAKNAEARTEAEKELGKIDGKKFILIRAASERGALFGSVTPSDVAASLSEAGVDVDKRQVNIDRPIKELGLHDLIVTLHPEVEATITVNVARNADEAELQASGKTIQDAAAEEEAAAEADLEALFEDINAAAGDDEDLAEQITSDEDEAEDEDEA
ncbi:50S ribosomal protein L9 [Paracoccaceae bacterium GXU_MW_L88]